MLIRSQDKTKMTILGYGSKVNTVDGLIYINDVCYGEYCSEEKAVKVMDMIFYNYKNNSVVNNNKYQIPQDEQVD